VFRPLLLALLVLAATAYAAEPETEDTPAAKNVPALKDPTEPYRPAADGGSGRAGPAPRFRLTAVLIAPTRRVAIVNGKPMQEGQRVAGAELVKIDGHSVQMREGGRDFVLQLGNASASAPHAEGDSVR